MQKYLVPASEEGDGGMMLMEALSLAPSSQ